MHFYVGPFDFFQLATCHMSWSSRVFTKAHRVSGSREAALDGFTKLGFAWDTWKKDVQTGDESKNNMKHLKQTHLQITKKIWQSWALQLDSFYNRRAKKRQSTCAAQSTWQDWTCPFLTQGAWKTWSLRQPYVKFSKGLLWKSSLKLFSRYISLL